MYSSGISRQYRNNVLHCDNGPAVIWPNGTEEWYLHGKRHREDGPAIMYPNNLPDRYFLHDVEYNIDEYKLYVFTYYNKKVN